MMGTAGCEPQLRARDTAAGELLTEAFWQQIKITTDKLR